MLQAAFEPIRHHPLAGPLRSHLSPGLRVTFYRNYAIYYLPRPEELIIVRVVHGARDIADIAERDGFA